MKMPSKTTMIRLGIALVVLVAAIVTGSLFAASKRPPVPGVIQLSPEQQSAADYDKALDRLSQEDTATAILLLERAVTLDRNNNDAATKLAELKKKDPEPEPPTTPPTNPGTNPPVTPPPPPGPDPFLGKIDLKKLMPAALDGFSLGSQQIIDPDATVAGEPNAANSGVVNILWAVHDRESEAAAQEFVDSRKNLYPTDPASVSIRGVTGYFGTDGTRFATVAFRRGRYAFEVLVTSSGVPGDQKTLAERAAAAFPAAP